MQHAKSAVHLDSNTENGNGFSWFSVLTNETLIFTTFLALLSVSLCSDPRMPYRSGNNRPSIDEFITPLGAVHSRNCSLLQRHCNVNQ